jgi:hypothetical protein
VGHSQPLKGWDQFGNEIKDRLLLVPRAQKYDVMLLDFGLEEVLGRRNSSSSAA